MRHRSAEAEWRRTHYRRAGRFPLEVSSPSCVPFLVDAEGDDWRVPIDETRYAVEWGSAEWFTLEPSGRMRYFDEERREVFPRVLDRLRRSCP
jgi:hypothetical protein